MTQETVFEQMRVFGINEETIEYCGLQKDETGRLVVYPLAYPPAIVGKNAKASVVYDKVYRARKLPFALAEDMLKDPATPRFINPRKEDCPNGEMPLFYTPDYEDLRQKVAQENGLLHVFEGDKDTWSAMSAGLFNSVGILSTGAKLNYELGYQLKKLGVKSVRYYPDNDNSGINFARKFVELLSSYGIQAAAYSLPVYTPSDGKYIKDNNDFWVSLGFDRESYVNRLFELPKWVVASKEQIEYSQNTDIFSKELYAEIVRRLGTHHFDAQGFSREAVACPVVEHSNDEKRPAFHWNEKSHVGYCFKCGKSYLTKDVAEGLGINWREYINRDAKDRHLPSIDTSTNVLKAKDASENIAASNLLYADPFQSEIATLENMYKEMPLSELSTSLDEAIEDYNMRIRGAQVPQYPPLPSPFKSLWRLGGNARIIARPCLVGIFGISGGFKTSFLSHVINTYVEQGYNGIVFSPEWSPERHADRTVQQYGGMKMSDMSLLQRYYYEQHLLANGDLSQEDPSLFGVKPDKVKLAKTYKAINEIKGFKGEIRYVKGFTPSLTHLLAQLRVIHATMSEQGKTPSFVIIDYAQMIEIPDNKRNWSVKHVVRKIKAETLKHGWVTFLASQSRKSDTESVQGETSLLSSTSGLEIRDDEFNLLLTVNPAKDTIVQSRKDPLTGEVTPAHYKEVKVAVVKNSEGLTAATIDTAVSFYVDLSRMAVIDEPEKAL